MGGLDACVFGSFYLKDFMILSEQDVTLPSDQILQPFAALELCSQWHFVSYYLKTLWGFKINKEGFL